MTPGCLSGPWTISHSLDSVCWAVSGAENMELGQRGCHLWEPGQMTLVLGWSPWGRKARDLGPLGLSEWGSWREVGRGRREDFRQARQEERWKQKEQSVQTGGVEKQEFSAETRRGGADGHGDQGLGHRGAVIVCLDDGALGGASAHSSLFCQQQRGEWRAGGKWRGLDWGRWRGQTPE